MSLNIVQPFALNENEKVEELTIQLLSKFIKNFRYGEQVIMGYDYMVDTLPKIIESNSLVIDNEEFQFCDVRIKKPTIKSCGDCNEIDLFPVTARLKGISYITSVWARIQYRINGVVVEKGTTDIHLFNIPVMIGSKICNICSIVNTYGDTEQRALGETVQDPKGYFIINGIERVFVGNQKVMINKFILQREKMKKKENESVGIISCLFYSRTHHGDTKIESIIDRQESGKEMLITLSKTKSDMFIISSKDRDHDSRVHVINCYTFLRSLMELYNNCIENEEFDNKDSLVEKINKLEEYFESQYFSFISTSNRLRGYEIILGTQVTSESSESIVTDESGRKIEKIISTSYDSSNNTIDFQKIKFLYNKIFPHVNMIYDNNKFSIFTEKFISFLFQKIAMLAYMFANITLFFSGDKKLDDRDHFKNLRVSMAHDEMITMMIKQMRMINENVKNNLERVRENILNEPKIRLNKVYGLFKTDYESEGTKEMFDKVEWNKKTILEELNPSTIQYIYHQITRFNIPISDNDTKIEVRLTHPSQYGYVDFANTPDGRKCGLHKHLALSAIITVPHDPEIDVIPFLSQKVSMIRENETHRAVFVNGTFYGWTDVNSLLKTLIAYRRQGKINRYISFAKDNEHLFISTEEGRLTRPLLAVENEELIIDKLNLWDKSWNEIVEAGCVDFIDTWESEMSVVSESVLNLRQRTNKNFSDDFISETRRKREMLSLLNEVEHSVQDNVKVQLPKEIQIPTKDLSRIFRQEEESIFVEAGKDLVKAFQESQKTTDEMFVPDLEKYQNTNMYDEVISRVRKSINDEIERTEEELRSLQFISLTMKRYSHSEINPITLFGVSSAKLPMQHHSQGARLILAQMATKSLGLSVYGHELYFPTTLKMSVQPQQPIVSTAIEETHDVSAMPSGNNVLVAFYADAFTQEDSIVIKKEAIERGLFKTLVYKTFKTTVTISERKDVNIPGKGIQPTEVREILVKPETRKPAHIYNIIDAKDGLPKIGEQFHEKQCIVGKMRFHFVPGTKKLLFKEDSSLYAPLYSSGTIDRIIVTKKPDSEQLVVRVRAFELKKPNEGDKFASRYAQKATIAKFRSEKEMPIDVDTGEIPDILINPHCISGRMTIGWLIELIMGSAGSLTGTKFDATTFSNFDYDKFKIILGAYGIRLEGRRMMNQMTGKMITRPINMGVAFHSALTHLVTDKIQMRGLDGPIMISTRQPAHNRQSPSGPGGIRFGEMETWALAGHGVSSILGARLCKLSDEYHAVFCVNCGTNVVSDAATGNISCRNCGKDQKIGRVVMPYATKLLMQQLASLGLKMKFNLQKKIMDVPINENVE